MGQLELKFCILFRNRIADDQLVNLHHVFIVTFIITITFTNLCEFSQLSQSLHIVQTSSMRRKIFVGQSILAKLLKCRLRVTVIVGVENARDEGAKEVTLVG